MVATRLNPCTAYQRLDRGGVDFPSKTTALITCFLEHCELGTFFGTPAVKLLVYSDFLNEKR